MTPFPLLLPELLGQTGAYLGYAAIGFFFGFVLEMAGFANSRKLAAQFYLVLSDFVGFSTVSCFTCHVSWGFSLGVACLGKTVAN